MILFVKKFTTTFLPKCWKHLHHYVNVYFGLFFACVRPYCKLYQPCMRHCSNFVWISSSRYLFWSCAEKFYFREYVSIGRSRKLLRSTLTHFMNPNWLEVLFVVWSSLWFWRWVNFKDRESIPSVCLNGRDVLLMWIGFGDQQVHGIQECKWEL